MAITSVGTLGTAAEGASSDSTLTLTTSATLNAGNVGVLAVASDNAGATGNTNHHSSVTDSGSNTYTKIYEYTYSPGSVAADGVTVSIWVVRPGSDLASGATVTMNQSANTAEKCASFWEYTAGAALQMAGTQQTAGSNTNHPGSLTIGSLTSKEYLFFRVVGKEVNTTTALTATTSYTTIDGTRSRNNSAAITIRGEFRILTGTGDTSNPTMNVISDTASIYVALEEAASGYTLTAATGSFSLTGNAASLLAARLLTASTGSYTLTGNAANLSRGFLLTADTGAYTLTGNAANLLAARLLTAAVGDYTLTGNDAALLAARRLTAATGAFTLTGYDATLTYTPGGGGYTMTAETGAFTLTGQDAALKAARLLSAQPGTFTLTGQDATLRAGRLLSAQVGTFTLTGQAAQLLAARILTAAPGTFTLTGQDVTLTYTAVAGPASVGIIELKLRPHVVNAVQPYRDPAARTLPAEPVNPVQPYRDPSERTLRQ